MVNLKKVLGLTFIFLVGTGLLTAVNHPLWPTPPAHTAVAQTTAVAVLGGTFQKWQPLVVDFNGPFANETDDAPNPFLDYRLQVTFTGPQGQTYTVPGFFAGDGQGHGSGNVWRVIFSPDAAGGWQYTASFRSGTDVAVELDPAAGAPHSFDGAGGSFTVIPATCDSPGFTYWGRLEYVGGHYLKFADGGYWIKGGADSPENFLAYAGFDNTYDQGGQISNFLHHYPDHVADWQPGDPLFSSNVTGVDAKGIIGALNYLAQKHVNSIYFLPMNLGGDGQDTYPFLGPGNTAYDKTHYDISKLEQWRQVFEHAQNKGIALHFVLAETELENERWFDNGTLGVERKLFYRELIARFGYLLAIKWNLSEENDFSLANIQAFSDYIRALDWAGHPIGVHTPADDTTDYEPLLGDGRITSTSIQYSVGLASSHVDTWRFLSTQVGEPWVLDMDENMEPLTDDNANYLRKRILYPILFSGGNIEWYMGYYELPLGGDLNLESFRTREAMWDFTWYARRFLYENVPFWEMVSQDDLLTGENISLGQGQVFASPGQVYAVYLPVADGGGQLNLGGVGGTFRQRWFNPRTGEFAGDPIWVNGGGSVSLGHPPYEEGTDWVVLWQHTAVLPATFPQTAGGNTAFLPLVMDICPPRAMP